MLFCRRLIFFSKSSFFRKILSRNIIIMSNSFCKGCQTFTSQLVCLILDMLGNFSCFFVAADFFKFIFFEIFFQGIPSECKTVWIQIRPAILSGLIWIQTFLQRLSKVYLTVSVFNSLHTG